MEEVLVRAGAAHQDADAACIADDHRADLQQLEPYSIRARLGQCSVLQCSAPQPLEQGVGQARQQLPELVRPPTMAGGATGKQVLLLVLDPVLHIAPGTVDLVVQVLVRLWQVRYHIPGISAMTTVLRLDNDPAWSIPGSGAIADRGKQPLFLAGDQIQALC